MKPTLFTLFPLLLLVFIFSANATIPVNPPKLYGKLHREVRYVDQDKAGYRKIVPTGSNVYNIPNRIGAYGFAYTSKPLTVGYIVELGLMDREGPYGYYSMGGVVLRLAHVYLVTDYGKLTLGKAYPASALVGSLLDPLADTGVSLYGLDQYLEVSDLDYGGIGYTFRSFRPLIGYETKKIANFQLKLSVDSDDNGKLIQEEDPARTVLVANGVTISDGNGYPPTFYEALLTYTPKFEKVQTKFSLGYVKPSGAGLTEKNRVIGALEVAYNGFKVGFLHQELAYEYKNPAYSVSKRKTKYMTVVASYLYENTHSIALTYGKVDFEKLDVGGDSIVTQHENSQIALGYRYILNRYVGLTASYGHIKRKEAESANAANNNKASRFMAGVALNF